MAVTKAGIYIGRGLTSEAPKVPRLRRRRGMGGDTLSPTDYGARGASVSSPSGMRGGARPKMSFGAFLA